MEEIKMYLEMLRPEEIRVNEFGRETIEIHVDHASAIADLLEGFAAKLDDVTNRMHAFREASEEFKSELKQEKKAASDLREENKILWSALNLATGRVRELWEGAR